MFEQEEQKKLHCDHAMRISGRQNPSIGVNLSEQSKQVVPSSEHKSHPMWHFALNYAPREHFPVDSSRVVVGKQREQKLFSHSKQNRGHSLVIILFRLGKQIPFEFALNPMSQRVQEFSDEQD